MCYIYYSEPYIFSIGTRVEKSGGKQYNKEPITLIELD